ncbi:DAPG hydrolase family protein [Loktanella salsilacus]|uniref:DAPG hydrolase family protein n=1 Tax=Loktanella salsilacus TaxID=195913 RepID=UPI003736824D
MSDQVYLGMKDGDLDGKNYAEFWIPEMQPLQPQVHDAVVHGSYASGLGIELEAASKLLKPGYLALENGVTKLDSGKHLIACLTKMPNLTGEMFEWWMGWHYMEPQRYKLWHPQAHLNNGTAEMAGDDPNLSNREKYQTSHFVHEYMGNDAAKVTITFSPATEYFPNVEDPYSDEITALVCGRIELRKPKMTIGHVIHQIRQVEGGAEMRSRFWMGRPQFTSYSKSDLRNRLAGSRVVSNLATPANFARDVLVHCGMEMNHLSHFLPDLFNSHQHS